MHERVNAVADLINEPPHYISDNGIECFDAMVASQGVYAVISFCECNVFKYIWRYRKKNGLEDLKKAQWYLNKAVELRETVEND